MQILSIRGLMQFRPTLFKVNWIMLWLLKKKVSFFFFHCWTEKEKIQGKPLNRYQYERHIRMVLCRAISQRLTSPWCWDTIIGHSAPWVLLAHLQPSWILCHSCLARTWLKRSMQLINGFTCDFPHGVKAILVRGACTQTSVISACHKYYGLTIASKRQFVIC